MNKAALLQLEHFNKSNALSWALTMGLFATPVVYSDREWNQIVGRVVLHPARTGRQIRVDGAGRKGLSDRGGQSGPAEGRDLPSLLSDGAGGGPQSAVAQSGLSKQRDFSITQEVLRAYGDAVKETIKQVLRAIGRARQDGLSIDVSGLDEFDIEDFSNELDDATETAGAGDRVGDAEETDFQEAGVQVSLRRAAGNQERIADEIEASQ